MRYWTVEEARAYLPRLKELVETIRHTGQVPGGQGRVPQRRARRPIAEAQEALEELKEGDIILRDATTGLSDFPPWAPTASSTSCAGGSGEDDLAWWHLPEEGFPGRKPLPRD